MSLKPRKQVEHAPNPNRVEHEWEGVTPCHDFQVEGEPGWFHFLGFVTTPKGHQYVDAYGGRRSGGKSWEGRRAFAPEKVKRGADGRPSTREREVQG